MSVAAPPDAAEPGKDGVPPSTEQLAAIKNAFNKLYAGLVNAKQLFESGHNNGREGAILALESVLKFLETSTVVQLYALHAPLAVLFDALMNLDDGVVRPILQTVPRSGRGSASAMRESIKGVVAFTVHRLCTTGVPAADARKFVARTLKEVGLSAERGRYPAVTERTIRGWCEDVAADVSRRREAAQTFDELQRDIPLASGSDPTPIRRDLLAQLRELICRTRGGQKPVNPPT
jgi:hypothetical protein